MLVPGTRSYFSLAVTMDTDVSGGSLICYLGIISIFSEVSIKAHTQLERRCGVWPSQATIELIPNPPFLDVFLHPLGGPIGSDLIPSLLEIPHVTPSSPLSPGLRPLLHLPSRPLMFAPSLSFISRSSHPYSKHLHTL